MEIQKSNISKPEAKTIAEKQMPLELIQNLETDKIELSESAKGVKSSGREKISRKEWAEKVEKNLGIHNMAGLKKISPDKLPEPLRKAFHKAQKFESEYGGNLRGCYTKHILERPVYVFDFTSANILTNRYVCDKAGKTIYTSLDIPDYESGCF